jgi:hypothetical protein
MKMYVKGLIVNHDTKWLFAIPCGMLKAACAWEDLIHNLARPVKSLRADINEGK